MERDIAPMVDPPEHARPWRINRRPRSRLLWRRSGPPRLWVLIPLPIIFVSLLVATAVFAFLMYGDMRVLGHAALVTGVSAIAAAGVSFIFGTKILWWHARPIPGEGTACAQCNYGSLTLLDAPIRMRCPECGWIVGTPIQLSRVQQSVYLIAGLAQLVSAIILVVAGCRLLALAWSSWHAA